MAGVPPLPPGGYTGPPYAPPPPGHGAHGTYVLPPRFEPFGGLATAATALLGIMAVLALFGLGAHLNRVGLIEREFRDQRLVSQPLGAKRNYAQAASPSSELPTRSGWRGTMRTVNP